jgi:selenide,water dikinase
LRRGPPVPEIRVEVLLAGGGHAHVQVALALGRSLPPDVRVTLVSNSLLSPYSGMLPGAIAGDWPEEAIHIDLVRLAAASGVRLVHAEVTGVDLGTRQLLLKDRPPLRFDLLSLNTGIAPDLSGIEGAEEFAIPVKPIGRFLESWRELLRTVSQESGPRRIAVIGGGAAGVELALAVRERLSRGVPPGALIEVGLFSAGPLVQSLGPRLAGSVCRALADVGVALHESCRIREISAAGVTAADGRFFVADAALVSTDARLPAWLAGSGLPLAANGGIAITPTLEVQGLDGIFAVGDCATLANDPRPRAGVFAVRQGPVLADNIRRRLAGDDLKPWRPQRDFLRLLRLSRDRALGARGGLPVVEGRWVRRWKDRIDRRFMAMFDPGSNPMLAMPVEDGEAMRCGGCAAKVGPSTLAAALRRLPAAPLSPAVRIGLDAPDDAALIDLGGGVAVLQSVDLFRPFTDDPWLFGRIAANHALSDIHAMGGTPTHALALAVVPHGRPSAMEETLFQLLAGVRSTLDAEGVALAGGHSAEGAELMAGLSVSGLPPARPVTKRGGRAGDLLILTKAIGTGIVLAAGMRAKAPAAAWQAAVEAMQVSNRPAAELLMREGVRAMTDVTGFGLAGHLLEMLPADLDAVIDLAALPLLPGVRELAGAGVASTSVPAGRSLLSRVEGGLALDDATVAVLLDPQTAGGLIAAAEPDRAVAIVRSLRAGGQPAAVIGRFVGGAARLRMENLPGPSPQRRSPANGLPSPDQS